MSADPGQLHAHLQTSLGSAYTVLHELGAAGMSHVFVAEEVALGRRVVIKLLAPDQAEGISAERFAREVRVSAQLQHPNIVPVFATGSANGIPYYTMPFVEGESLRARLDRSGSMPVADAVAILRDVARALSHAHEQGLVHRDIKPDNILLSSDAAVVADFGIAKAFDAARAEDTNGSLTQMGVALGTPAYMAPEQAAGGGVDHRADLYAWGVVAYELLGGSHPFTGKRTAQAFMVAHLVESPQPLDQRRPGLSPSLVSLVARCMSKEPADRPNNARELIEQLTTVTSLDAARPVPVRPSLPSVAVLPFINLSADPENEYFSDGIAEEVLNLLAQDKNLRVAPRSSSFVFKGQQVAPQSIAAQLHVTTLLEGSVRRSANRVRITARLVNPPDGNHRWSDRFDRELTDIFAMQDEIAGAIAATLHQHLVATEVRNSGDSTTERRQPEPLRTRQRISAEAHDEYLKGLHLNRYDPGVGHARARAHFERALAIEPGFAAAHAGLAESHYMLVFTDGQPTENFARIRRHALRALALDPDLADAHWLLAETSVWHDWDIEASESHIRNTFNIERAHPGALRTAAFCHMMRQQRDECLATAAAAVEADPLNIYSRWGLVACMSNVGEQELAIAEASRLISEHPGMFQYWRWRAVPRLVMGDIDGAAADVRMANSIEPPNVWALAIEATIAAHAGNTAETRRIRDEYAAQASQKWMPVQWLGRIEQALGDYDAAFALYERAYHAREHLLTVLHTDRQFGLTPPGRADSIYDDPRWVDLVGRIGLAP